MHQVRNRDGELKKLKRSFDLINGVGVGVRDGVLLRSAVVVSNAPRARVAQRANVPTTFGQWHDTDYRTRTDRIVHFYLQQVSTCRTLSCFDTKEQQSVEVLYDEI